MKKILICLLGLLIVPTLLLAATPFRSNVNGKFFHWDTSEPIKYNMEDYGIKPEGIYTKEKTHQLVRQAFDIWMNTPGINLDAIPGEVLIPNTDINVNNFQQFLLEGVNNCYQSVLNNEEESGKCYSPIIFDSDGSIVEAMFGECNQYNILGFARFDTIDNGTDDPERLMVRRGVAVINGTCLAPVQAPKNGCGGCPREITEDRLLTMMVHELGHFLGLGHSQINEEAFEKCRAGGCSGEMAEYIPTMIPMSVSGANLNTLHRDEQAFMQELYGDEGKSCSVVGRVVDQSGTEIQGVEVVARNTAPSKGSSDALGFVTGAGSPRDSKRNCSGNCGGYNIYGLANGQTYQLCSYSINPAFSGISMVGQGNTNPPQNISTCPNGLTVTCQCEGGSCPEIKVQDLVLGSAEAVSVTPPTAEESGGGKSGGCSMSLAPKNYPVIWMTVSLYIMGIVGALILRQTKKSRASKIPGKREGK